jgi:hypothetical protein
MEEAAVAPVKLHSLGGQEVPGSLLVDLRKVLDLPPAARASLWQALGPSLPEPMPPDAEGQLQTFCTSFAIPPEDLARVLRAQRFLLREATALDVPSDAFADDLTALFPADPAVKEVLAGGYERAKALIRNDILNGTLADHGKLMVGVDWKVESIGASNRGAHLGLPAAVLTLRYREGNEAGRITLQLLPEMVRELRKACEKILA